MAGLSERRNAFFRLSPAENGKTQCFAVRRGETRGQGVSAALYAPQLRLFVERLRKNPNTSGLLGDYVSINPRIDVRGLEPGALVSFVPMDAVEDQATGSFVRLERTLAEVQRGYTPFGEGDILWAKITPCMENGKTCIATGLTNGVGFGSTEFHVLRARDSRLSQAFLWEFLSLDLLRKAAPFAFTGSAGHQRVPDSFLGDLPFPLLPPGDQKQLVAAMGAARIKRQAKLAEADALLAGLDGYVLNALGLTPPAKDERKVFAVSKSLLGSQARLNADYFHPERILALRALEGLTQQIDCPRLEQVVDFIREQIKTPGPNYLGLANVQSHTGELVQTEEDVKGGCSTFQKGDVLFARLRPYLNKVYAAESDGCCSPEFHVLRVKDTHVLQADYLAAILRSSLTLAQTRHMMTGNTHPRLSNEDVVNLVIPIPKPVVQEAIAAEARRRREEARRLRAEAEAGWQAAKHWFEEQLLGPAQP